MKLNDNTILRIKVPAHLYESVKAQLTINEGHNFGTKDMKAVKVKDSSSGDKPKKTAAPKKANAPVEEEKEKMEEAKEELKEYEVIYVIENGRCYRKDDEGNWDEVSMSKCR